MYFNYLLLLLLLYIVFVVITVVFVIVFTVIINTRRKEKNTCWSVYKHNKKTKTKNAVFRNNGTA